MEWIILGIIYLVCVIHNEGMWGLVRVAFTAILSVLVIGGLMMSLGIAPYAPLAILLAFIGLISLISKIANRRKN